MRVDRVCFANEAEIGLCADAGRVSIPADAGQVVRQVAQIDRPRRGEESEGVLVSDA